MPTLTEFAVDLRPLPSVIHQHSTHPAMPNFPPVRKISRQLHALIVGCEYHALLLPRPDHLSQSDDLHCESSSTAKSLLLAEYSP
jgi:hypothetical protein